MAVSGFTSEARSQLFELVKPGCDSRGSLTSVEPASSPGAVQPPPGGAVEFVLLIHHHLGVNVNEGPDPHVPGHVRTCRTLYRRPIFSEDTSDLLRA